MSACENPLPFAERFRRQHRVWAAAPFKNCPLDEFPKWMFKWRETNRCPECIELAWCAIRDTDGQTCCANCGTRLPDRWFTDRRLKAQKEDNDE